MRSEVPSNPKFMWSLIVFCAVGGGSGIATTSANLLRTDPAQATQDLRERFAKQEASVESIRSELQLLRQNTQDLYTPARAAQDLAARDALLADLARRVDRLEMRERSGQAY